MEFVGLSARWVTMWAALFFLQGADDRAALSIFEVLLYAGVWWLHLGDALSAKNVATLKWRNGSPEF